MLGGGDARVCTTLRTMDLLGNGSLSKVILIWNLVISPHPRGTPSFRNLRKMFLRMTLWLRVRDSPTT